MTHDDQDHGAVELRRTRLAQAIPDDVAARKLLADDCGPMTLRESACYIAGYVSGFASGSADVS